MSTPPVGDRLLVRQFSDDEVVGLSLNVADVPTDPDGSAVTVVMREDSTSTVVLDTPATRASIGRYEVVLNGPSTDVPGYFTLTFYYQLNGTNERYDVYIEVVSGVQEYDQLDPEFQTIVDNVEVRFRDLFDSPQGGPHLLTYYQSHFTPARYAQLLRIALGTMNTISQPVANYTLDGDGGPKFPVARWGALLEKALYIEVVRHLRRSYLEQPMLVGGEVTRHDRRDYFERWGTLLNEEVADFNKQVETFKIQHMFSSGPRVLVSGGAYGQYGPTRLPLSAAARPRYYSRWY